MYLSLPKVGPHRFRPSAFRIAHPRPRPRFLRHGNVQRWKATEEEIVFATEELELDAEDRMGKTIAALTQKLNTVRTGRANPNIFDRVMVDYYGAPTPLKSLAGVSVPDAGTLIINPFDKGAIDEIEKAIRQSDLGLTPNNDGEKIRLIVPQLTEQRRQELAKTVAKLCEDAKVAIRNIRRDVVKASGKVGMSEDAEKDFKDTLQKQTDETINKIESILKDKQRELTAM